MSHNPLQTSLDKAIPELEGSIERDAPAHNVPVNETTHRAAIMEAIQAQQDWENGKLGSSSIQAGELTIYRDAALARAREFQGKARMHIGFAGFFNLDMVSTAKSDLAVLCDVNANQKKFWDAVIEIIAQHESPSSFKKAFAEHFKFEDGNVSFRVSDTEYVPLRSRHSMPNSESFIPTRAENFFGFDQRWLHDADKYAHLHRLAENGHIVTAVVNAFNETQLNELRHWIDHDASAHLGKPAVVDTIYASNIYCDIGSFYPAYNLLHEALRTVKRLADTIGAKHGVNFRKPATKLDSEDSQETYKNARDELASQLVQWLSKEAGNTTENATAIDEKIAIAEAFLTVYRQSTDKAIDHSALQSSEVDVFQKQKPAKLSRAYRIFQEIWMHTEEPEKILVQLDLLRDPTRMYGRKIDTHAALTPDYHAFQLLANSPHSITFHTSVYQRPMAVLEGMPSPSKAWRERESERYEAMRAAGQLAMV